MTGTKFIVRFKRKRQHKTNYKRRLTLIKFGGPRLVIRRSTNKITAQIVRYKKEGDETLVHADSKELVKYGWKGNLKNIPSAYLTGFLCALKASKNKIKEAILDIGLYPGVKNSKVYSALVGAVEGGLKISYDKDVFPEKERITGKHIAKYALELKKSNLEKYKKLFSDYLKKNLQPEDIEKHFEEIKNKIVKEYGK